MIGSTTTQIFLFLFIFPGGLSFAAFFHAVLSEQRLRMAVMSLPSMVADFEGEISHAVVTGNETLLFVKPSTWQGEWEKIDAKLQSLVPSLEKVTSLSEVKSGNFVNFHLDILYPKKRCIWRKEKAAFPELIPACILQSL